MTPFLVLLLNWIALASTQQYAGDTIPNSLPTYSGIEIAYFRVPDPSSANNKLTLINYSVLGSNGQRVTPSSIKRAVIMVHGQNRNAGDYAQFTLNALKNRTDGEVNRDTVAIVAPFFADELDQGKGYPYSNGASTSNALVWQGKLWSYGNNNIYPTSSKNTSTFYALDSIVRYFDNATTFPNLKQIVVGGHSMGGATVHRYAAISTLQTRVPLTYWIGNPNDYLWFNSSRPFSTANCPDYDSWRNGLAGYATNMTYGNGLVSQGNAAVLANTNSKQLAILRALQDHGDESIGCGPFTEGKDRFERFQKYIQWFPVSCPSPSSRNCDTIDYVDAVHDAQAAMISKGGIARLFTDNFSGNGSRAYDVYYPRLQAGDDPYPDPSKV